MAEKLNRNDPCHCGSGKKYKNCHMDKDNSRMGSKLGVLGLVVVLILGFWLAGKAISGGGTSAPECPAGTSWSESHQHCH